MWVELDNGEYRLGGILKNLENGTEITIERDSSVMRYEIVHRPKMDRAKSRMIYFIDKDDVENRMDGSEADIEKICEEEIEVAYNNLKRKLGAEPIKMFVFQ